MDEHEIPHLLLSCFIEGDRQDQIIKDNLFSNNENVASDAEEAIHILIQHGQEIGCELKNEIISAYNTSNSYRIHAYPKLLELLVRKKQLGKEQCDEIAGVIIKYDDITAIGSLDTEEIIGEKLLQRTIVSILAHSLYNYYEDNDLPMPEGVLHWKALSESDDEFAEIRRVWG